MVVVSTFLTANIALHFAAEKGHIAVVDALLKAGAKETFNSRNNRPSELAQNNNYASTQRQISREIRLLVRRGTKDFLNGKFVASAVSTFADLRAFVESERSTFNLPNGYSFQIDLSGSCVVDIDPTRENRDTIDVDIVRIVPF